MPLLDILELMEWTRPSCWLDQETKDNYQYAMNHLRALLDVVLLHPMIVTVCWVARAWCQVIPLNVHDAHFDIDHAQSASWLNTLRLLLSIHQHSFEGLSQS